MALVFRKTYWLVVALFLFGCNNDTAAPPLAEARQTAAQHFEQGDALWEEEPEQAANAYMDGLKALRPHVQFASGYTQGDILPAVQYFHTRLFRLASIEIERGNLASTSQFYRTWYDMAEYLVREGLIFKDDAGLRQFFYQATLFTLAEFNINGSSTRYYRLATYLTEFSQWAETRMPGIWTSNETQFGLLLTTGQQDLVISAIRDALTSSPELFEDPDVSSGALSLYMEWHQFDTLNPKNRGFRSTSATLARSYGNPCDNGYDCGEWNPKEEEEEEESGGGGSSEEESCGNSCKDEQQANELTAEFAAEQDTQSSTVAQVSAAGTEAAAEINATQTQQRAEENLNSQQGSVTHKSGCPVSISCGSKITSATDLDGTTLNISRQHRLSHESAWSLGAGWHWGMDSRLIWGTSPDVTSAIATLESSIQSLQGTIDDLQARKTYYQLKYDTAFGDQTRTIATQALALIDSYLAQLTPQLNDLNQQLSALQTTQTRSQQHQQRNQFATDPNHRTEELIGVQRLKWVSPKGDRILFREEGTGYVAEGVNTVSLAEWSDGLEIRATEGLRYRYNTHGMLVQIVQGDDRTVTLTRDAQQRITTITDHEDRSYAVQYSGTRITRITDPVGRALNYSYDSQGRLVQVSGFDGSTESYLYEYATNPLAITQKIDGEGHASVYAYREQDGKTVVDRQTDPAGHAWTYIYDFENRITDVRERSFATDGAITRYAYGENRLTDTQTHLPGGQQVQFEYDDRGNRVAVINPTGDTSTFTYDAQGNVTWQRDPTGRTTTFERDAQGRLLSLTDHDGHRTEYVRNGQGQVTEIRLPTGETVQQDWQGNRLVRRIDEAGHRTDWTYDSNGYPAEITYTDAVTQAQRTERLEYDAMGRLLLHEDALGRMTRYSYTQGTRSLNQPTRVTDPSGRHATFVYDGNNRLVQETDFSGVQTLYTYTPRGEVASKTIVMPNADGNGSTEYAYTYEYDANNRLIKATHPGGDQHSQQVWLYTYDTRGNLTRAELQGTELHHTYEYDAAGRKTREEDATGSQQTFDYHPDGRLRNLTNALNNTQSLTWNNQGQLDTLYDSTLGAYVVQYEHDARGQVTAATDARGHQTRLERDARGQLATQSAPGNPQQDRITRQYNQRGQVIQQTDATGGQIDFTYNAAGELIEQRDNLGGEHTFAYDDLGRRIAHTTPAGLEITWVYNQTARYLDITRTELDPGLPTLRTDRERRERERYDLMGRLIETEDAAGQLWRYRYDTRGLLTQIDNPDGSALTLTYNHAGHLTEETLIAQNGDTRRTQYQRDALGRVTQRIAPHGAQTRYQYNALGQLQEITLPDGFNRITHHYDARGRKIATYYPEGLSEHWDYDAADNIVRYTDRNGDTQVLEYTPDNQVSVHYDAEAVRQGYAWHTQYHYDPLGRPVGMTDPNGNTQTQVRDALGRVIEQRDAYEKPITYERDAAGRVQAVIDRNNARTDVHHNAFGEVERVIDPLNNQTRYTYDELGRRVAQINALNDVEHWAYNLRHQVTEHTDTLGRTTEHHYDDFGNLTRVTLPDGASTRYTYDTGNRLTEIIDANNQRERLEYNERDELVQRTNALNLSTRYQYDGLGRVTEIQQPQAGTDIQLAYNGRDQLVERRFQGIVERQAYDARGNLTQIDSPANREDYQYDPAGNQVAVLNHTLNQRIDYAYDANNQRAAMHVAGGASTTYARDAMGRIRELTLHRSCASCARDVSASLHVTGETTYFERDPLGRITERYLPNGTRDLTLYDELGRTRAIVQQQQDSQQWSGFDAKFFNSFQTPSNPRWQARDHAQDWSATQQQLSQQFNQDGWSTQDQHLYFHDSEGNLSARTYNEKFSFFYDYDENDRLVRADEPQNLTTTYQWDAVGNLTHKQVRDLSYQYHYNDGNQLVQADHWRLRHSGGGNSRGNDNNAYNSNGILSNWDIHHLDQQHLFEFMWDPSVNHNQDKLTQTYAYNQNGQLTQKNLGNGASETYQHDALGRMTAQTTEYGAQYQFAYDAQDRRVHTQLSDWERSYQYGSLYDGRQELAQWDNQGNPYRTLNYLPGEQGLPYGTLISQNVHQWQNDEFRVTGFAQNYAETGYFHQDHLGSTVKITGPEAGNAFRWDYTPQGEAYGFTHRYSHEQMTRTHVGHSPKRHLVPYLYTGQYETNLTGLIHMDARWYNPQLGRWLQPDYYSFNQLALPQSARHQLLASTTLNTQQLLRDPSQQMAYGYVSGNPLRWVDPMGLVEYFIGGGADKADFLARLWPTKDKERRDLGIRGTGNMNETMDWAIERGLITANDSAYYGHEDADEIIADIIARVALGETSIKLTGHSYGAAAAMRITEELKTHGISVERLVTLDPVSTFGNVPRPATNANTHINMHQRQTLLDKVVNIPIVGNAVGLIASGIGSIFSSKIDGSDVIATAGNQLGAIKGAQNVQTNLHHYDSRGMYLQAIEATRCP
ncbi:RHS repeat-associated core domain-containing protein [Salinispirillum marinum]|uniref:RHS repeat-associated core domain-containing protein n=2 Tax=Saccharospirillaceae TaxID=255527 RepID=A0ABV8BEH8_9GAMM